MGEISNIDRLRILAEQAQHLAAELKAVVEAERARQGLSDDR